jgi:Uma2 family endonuclease
VDVLFPAPGLPDEDSGDVVQPDIVVVCDPSKLEGGRYVRGGPDLAVEILSPSTSKKDMSEKFDLFEKGGVREYWIVEPRAHWLQRYARGGDGRFGRPLVRDFGDGLGPAPSVIFEGFSFNLTELFAD